MAFVFAYSLNGDGANVVKDYSLDTPANYKTGAGTNDFKKGDLVFLNAGLLRRVIAGTASGTNLGVLEGGEFLGLAQGGLYAAVDSSFVASAINKTKNPNGVGKVRIDKTANVFKVPVKSGQTAANANINVAYGVALDAAGDQTVDLTNTTTTHCRVIDFTPDGKFVFVTLT